MAQQGDLERRCTDKASKIQAVIRGFVSSLSEILTEEDLFEEETNLIGSVLCQTEAELKIRLEQLRRLRTDTTSGVGSGFECDDDLAGSRLHSKVAIQRCGYPEGEAGMCRHFRKDHPQLMDSLLWETLPAEVVERICALLPLSKILKLLKLCRPWSRLPTATNFRRFCAQAHRDLFGILVFNNIYLTYRLAIYDAKHEEWSHLGVNGMPSDFVDFSENVKLVFGHDGGLICVAPHDFHYFEEPPRIPVFNPLTGDKKYIGVSRFIASFDKEEMYAVLLQIITDAELGCYKLILVTQRRKPNYGGTVYFSESYDSVSGLWSTLDSGFVYGDGMMGEERCHVCFDCGLKNFCAPRVLYETSQFQPHVYTSNFCHCHYPTAYPHYTFVRDHRFWLDVVKAEIWESVFQNGCNKKDTILRALEMPYEDFDARLLACTRFVLLVADVADIDFEDRHHMILYDRVTGKEVCDIPQILDIHEFHTGNDFMDRDLHFMCDLKWDALP